MIPHPITDSDSLELAFAGAVKAGFPSPAEEVREKLGSVPSSVSGVGSAI